MSPCKIGVRNQKSQSSDANVTTSLTGDSMLLMPGIPFKVHLKQVKLCVCVCMYINQKDKLILKIIIMSCGTCPKFFEVLSFRKAIEPCPSRKNLPPPPVAPVVLWAQGPPTTRVSHQGPSGRWLVNRSTYPYRIPAGETMKPMVHKPLVRPYFWRFIREGRLTSHYITKNLQKTIMKPRYFKKNEMLKNCNAINLSNVISSI